LSAPPGKSTRAEAAADVEAAIAAFRVNRIAEPLQAWSDEVNTRVEEFERLLDVHDIAKPHELNAQDVPAIIQDGLLDALRYLPGPPISSDDLKTLSEVRSLSPAKLRAQPENAERLLSTIVKGVDPFRFAWLAENREPTADERRLAILASALLHAAQRVPSDRRNISKRVQESTVREHLASIGFAGRELKRVRTSAQFPEQGVYSLGEVSFGPKRADVIAKMWDDRVIPIECTVSNSAVDSFKGLNDTTIAKLKGWNLAFGESNITPSAVLCGVYSIENVMSAQADGLLIFWAHRVEDLGAFVESTKR